MGILTLDRKYKLVLFRDHLNAIAVLMVSIFILLIADLVGIWAGIFSSGASKYMTNIYLAADLPIEELFFLFLLTYCSMVVYSFLEVRSV